MHTDNIVRQTREQIVKKDERIVPASYYIALYIEFFPILLRCCHL